MTESARNKGNIWPESKVNEYTHFCCLDVLLVRFYIVCFEIDFIVREKANNHLNGLR